jgi:hypothetical protein
MKTGRQIAERWLYDTLSPLGSVYRGVAPREAAYPYLAVNMVSGRDRRAGRDPVGVEIIQFDVSAWDEGTSAKNVNLLASQVVQAIDSAESVYVDGGMIVSCKRQSLIPLTGSEENGKRYQRDGAIYELMIVSNY